MSGRQANGWGECVYCGEMLKPEDKDNTSDHCEFCSKWIDVAQVAIKREHEAIKHISKAQKEKNETALAYWQKRKDGYHLIHFTMIQALNVKKYELWGECW